MTNLYLTIAAVSAFASLTTAVCGLYFHGNSTLSGGKPMSVSRPSKVAAFKAQDSGVRAANH